MQISKKRKAGEILGRARIAERIIELAQEAVDGSYKNAMHKAGQIKVLAEAATYDDYWGEKTRLGEQEEEFHLTRLNQNPELLETNLNEESKWYE